MGQGRSGGANFVGGVSVTGVNQELFGKSNLKSKIEPYAIYIIIYAIIYASWHIYGNTI